MFKAFIFSFKKSKLLSKISKEYSKDSIFGKAMNNQVIGNTMEDKKVYLEQLLLLLSKDTAPTTLLKYYNKSFDDIKNIIENLELNGAGQIRNGHYIPISSIAFLDTLQIVLEHWNIDTFKIENLDSHNSNLSMSNFMLTKF